MNLDVRVMSMRLQQSIGGLWILGCSHRHHSINISKYGIQILLKFLLFMVINSSLDVASISIDAKIYSHAASPTSVHRLIACSSRSEERRVGKEDSPRE